MLDKHVTKSVRLVKPMSEASRLRHDNIHPCVSRIFLTQSLRNKKPAWFPSNKISFTATRRWECFFFSLAESTTRTKCVERAEITHLIIYMKTLLFHSPSSHYSCAREDFRWKKALLFIAIMMRSKTGVAALHSFERVKRLPTLLALLLNFIVHNPVPT